MRLLRLTVATGPSATALALALGVAWTTAGNVPAAAAPAPGRLSVLWTQTHGGPDDWFEYRTAALSARNEVWVGFGSRDFASGSVSSWIWRVGPDGATRGTYRLEEPPEQQAAPVSYSDVKGVMPLHDGGVLVVVGFAGDRPWLVRLDADGRQVAAAPISGRRDRSEFIVSRVIATPDGQYVLLGHTGLDALVVKIDATGKVLWEHRDDRGKMDFYVDGLANPDGSLLVVGNSGTYDYNFDGESVVFVRLFDRNGKPQTEKTWPGREGSVARGADGGYAIVYDRSTSVGRRIVMQVLGPNLDEQRSVSVAEFAEGRGRFAVFQAGRGTDFLVSGPQASRAYVVRVGSEAAAGVALAESLDAGLNFDSCAAPDGLVLASSVLTQMPGKRSGQALKLMRLVYR